MGRKSSHKRKSSELAPYYETLPQVDKYPISKNGISKSPIGATWVNNNEDKEDQWLHERSKIVLESLGSEYNDNFIAYDDIEKDIIEFKLKNGHYDQTHKRTTLNGKVNSNTYTSLYNRDSILNDRDSLINNTGTVTSSMLTTLNKTETDTKEVLSKLHVKTLPSTNNMSLASLAMQAAGKFVKQKITSRPKLTDDLFSPPPLVKSENTDVSDTPPPPPTRLSRIVEASPNSPTITFKMHASKASAVVKETVKDNTIDSVDKENKSIASNSNQEYDFVKDRRKSTTKRKSMLPESFDQLEAEMNKMKQEFLTTMKSSVVDDEKKILERKQRELSLCRPTSDATKVVRTLRAPSTKPLLID